MVIKHEGGQITKALHLIVQDGKRAAINYCEHLTSYGSTTIAGITYFFRVLRGSSLYYINPC